MKTTAWKLFTGDLLILALAVALPGIRGYSDWQIHEYVFLVFICGYIIFLRHKKSIK